VEVASSLLFLFDRVRGERSISELSFGDLSPWKKGALRGEIAEWIGVSVNLAGEPRIPREWIGSCTGTLRAGGNRPSAEGLREISSFADALSSDRGGDFSNDRVWSSFFLRLFPSISAGDLNWKWLWRRPKPEGADSRDLSVDE
jgi:hypothetical protein